MSRMFGLSKICCRNPPIPSCRALSHVHVHWGKRAVVRRSEAMAACFLASNSLSSPLHAKSHLQSSIGIVEFNVDLVSQGTCFLTRFCVRRD